MSTVDGTMPAASATHPDGEYAIVEVLGHRTIVGRVSEVQRFGATLLAIEPIFQGELLAAVYIGGASIYQHTGCSADVAFREAPKHHYQLPASIRVTVPAPSIPSLGLIGEDEPIDEDQDGFDPVFLQDIG